MMLCISQRHRRRTCVQVSSKESTVRILFRLVPYYKYRTNTCMGMKHSGSRRMLTPPESQRPCHGTRRVYTTHYSTKLVPERLCYPDTYELGLNGMHCIWTAVSTDGSHHRRARGLLVPDNTAIMLAASRSWIRESGPTNVWGKERFERVRSIRFLLGGGGGRGCRRSGEVREGFRGAEETWHIRVLVTLGCTLG